MNRKQLVDLAERAGAVFGATVAATYAPVVLGAQRLNELVDLSVVDRGLTAGIAAGVVTVLGALGVKVGSDEDVSVLKHKVK